MLRSTLVALTTLVALGLTRADAANLLPNPNFDADTQNWEVNILSNHTLAWAKSDELDLDDSGALAITNMAPNSMHSVFAPCLPVEPGQHLTFGAAAHVSEGAPSTVRVQLWQYSDAICSGGNVVAGGDLRYNAPRTTWGAIQGQVVVADGVQRVRMVVLVVTGDVTPPAVLVDNAFVYADRSCAETASTMCLADGRFRVSAEWQTPEGARGWAKVIGLTADSGYLWFFKPDNTELILKVLDACAFNEHLWVFAAGLTNMGVDLKVVDTLSGEAWTYSNQLGEAFPPVQDVEAFSSCKP